MVVSLLLPSLAASQTYRVAGTILSSTEGHPLSRARVTLSNPRTGKPIQSMITGDDGHFEFTNVPAGKYPLTGAKRGYFTAAYNQHEQFSTAIVTGANVDTEHLTLRIAPLAQISGQVFDEHGDPVRNARLTLWKDDHSSGISRTRRMSNETTDDLGSYEFATLAPGTYFLSVTAEPWYAVHPSANSQDVDHSLDVVYPTTYYSGAIESEEATPILVRGGDRLQFDLHLLPVAALHVLFRTPPGQESFATPMLFKRVFDELDLPQRQATQMVSPGVFEIITAPGHFRVNVPANGNFPSRTTDVDIAQDNQELDASSGEPLATLAATVEIPGESQIPQPLFLTLRDAKGHRVSTSQSDPLGAATFNDLRPGKYTLSAFASNQFYVVASVTPIGPGNARGKPVSGNAVNILAGSNQSIALTLIGGSSHVEGFVQQNGKPFAGAMVVLVPAHPDAHREFFRRDQSDLDGSFGLPGVVPGSYTAVAIEDGWDLDWSQPNVIARYAARGQKVTVPANTKTVKLPVPIELQPK